MIDGKAKRLEDLRRKLEAATGVNGHRERRAAIREEIDRIEASR